jgi:hypothetical protein
MVELLHNTTDERKEEFFASNNNDVLKEIASIVLMRAEEVNANSVVYLPNEDWAYIRDLMYANKYVTKATKNVRIRSEKIRAMYGNPAFVRIKVTNGNGQIKFYMEITDEYRQRIFA